MRQYFADTLEGRQRAFLFQQDPALSEGVGRDAAPRIKPYMGDIGHYQAMLGRSLYIAGSPRNGGEK